MDHRQHLVKIFKVNDSIERNLIEFVELWFGMMFKIEFFPLFLKEEAEIVKVKLAIFVGHFARKL